jgi:hypothetical protein
LYRARYAAAANRSGSNPAGRRISIVDEVVIAPTIPARLLTVDAARSNRSCRTIVPICARFR